MSYLRYGSTPPIRNMIQKHRTQQELIIKDWIWLSSHNNNKNFFQLTILESPSPPCQWESSIMFLVELVSVEQDSLVFPKWSAMVPGVASRDFGNWGKNHDNFGCMQISLVMSRVIFSDDWNDACKLITFFTVWQRCNFPWFMALDFCVIMHVY